MLQKTKASACFQNEGYSYGLMARENGSKLLMKGNK
jgi:hypothetical protein